MMEYVLPKEIDASFEVIAETEGWIAVSKGAPLLSHPSSAKNEPTLWHGLQELLSYELANGGQISIITRLDRETSGIVLVAKSAAAARTLGKAMERREIRKRYLALVIGNPTWETAECCEPIAQQSLYEPGSIFVKQFCHSEGRPCRTEFHTLKRLNARGNMPPLTLIECIPHTGRMHQIRVHLAQLGYPILGDKIYGKDETCYLDFIANGMTPELKARLLFHRHALHAYELSFQWNGIEFTLSAPLLPDMAAFLE